jgi:peptide deformylase
MAKLDILRYPDPKLQTVAKPVQAIDARIRTLVADMLERVMVMDVSENRDEPIVLINPTITWMGDERVKGEEGCLSVPGIYDGVERATAIKVSAQDADGKTRELEAEGLFAVCVQHELDHLMGKVFVEYLSPLKRSRIKSKFLKALRDEE